MVGKAFGKALKRASCFGMSVVMAACMAVPVAQAYDGAGDLSVGNSGNRALITAQSTSVWTAPGAPVSAADIERANVVTVGGHGSSVSLPEMLGLNGTVIAKSLVSGKTADQARQINRLGVYGSSANANPNPYLVNTFYNLSAAGQATKSSEAATVVSVASTSESSFNNEEEEDLGVPADLAHRPDIVMGITGASGNLRTDRITYNASTSDFRNYSSWQGLQSRLYILNVRRWTDDESLVGTKNSDGNDYLVSKYYLAGDNSFDPVGLDYSSSGSLEATVEHANALAYAAKLVMQQRPSKSSRYGDPLSIANDFERYVKATKWYVLSKIGNRQAEKKVAVVSRVKDGAFELLKMNPDGNADLSNSTYRVLEATQDTVRDLAAELDTGDGAKPASVENPVKATAAQLSAADVVVCLPKWANSYDSSAASVRSAMSAAGISSADMPAIFDWSIPNGTYENNVQFLASDESALLVGLIQGFMYSDQVDIDPIDLTAYFCSRFLHLDGPSLKSFVQDQLSGVSLPAGASASDDSHYTDKALAAVADKLDEGAAYYYANKSVIDAARPKITSTDALDDAYGVGLHDVKVDIPNGATCTVYDDHGLIVGRNPDGTFTLDATDPSTLEVSLSGYRMDPRTVAGTENVVKITTDDMIAVKRVTFDLPAGASVAVRVGDRDVASEPDGSFMLDCDKPATYSVTLTGYELYSRAIPTSTTSVKVRISDMKRATVWTKVTIPAGSTLRVTDADGKTVSAVSGDNYPLVYGLRYTFLLSVSGSKTYTQVVTGGPAAMTVYKSQMTGVVLNKSTVVASDLSSADAKNIREVTLGPKVKRIAKGAFANCTRLKSATFGKNVQSIGDSAFSGCKNLKSVVLGGNVQTFGKRAFANCSAVVSLAVPSKTVKIGSYAFSGCKGLKAITVKSNKLTKSSVVGALANSSVKTVKVAVGNASVNKKFVAKYKKFFTKANCGRAVAVK